jgi:hypothetical protein
MGATRLLTKSRFKIGCECPTKLLYKGNPEYGDTSVDNKFLKELARGGFQVGALAQVYHPDGVHIATLDPAQAVKETAERLKQENITLFEAALQSGDYLVRVDILIKRGNRVELIEVKAKSIDPTDPDQFYDKRTLKKPVPQFKSDWEEYLLDIAFQGFVAQQAYPKWQLSHHLMLADKTTVTTQDGINQRFFLEKEDHRNVRVTLAPGTNRSTVGDPILTKICVDREVRNAHQMTFDDGRSFAEKAQQLADIYRGKIKALPQVGSQCKGCEFRIGADKKAEGLKSAFEECWVTAHALKPEDFQKPFVFDVWNFRKTDELIKDGRVFAEDVKQTDINIKTSDEPGLTASQRQWLQVETVIEGSNAPYLDAEALSAEFEALKYPLHFIDFETTMVAIPFYKGRRPYEQIAFQFSHHMMHQDGRVEHKTQYLNREKGKFPNFDFVRALRKAVGDQGGTIFRYAPHENTVLCQIREQLRKSQEEDRGELIEWIETITRNNDKESGWKGHRDMVDLCEWVKRYFYHPKTGGSNSIKKVLPAILSDPGILQTLYSKPTYGSTGGISSLNFKDWTWLKRDKKGKLLDPYKQLPPVFSDLELEEMDSLITDQSIEDGGAAMTAYARMQFTQMSDAESERVSAALLKYCELDTLAMVMLFQYWQELLAKSKTLRKAV